MKKKTSWEKIEEIRNMGFCCLKIKSDYNYYWNIQLIPGYDLQQKDEQELHEPEIEMQGENWDDLVKEVYKEAKKYVANNKKR